ncbi:peroxisome proliferator-activated receptor gamma coactivator 1-beta [Geospiza fortis]|uniref:Peroxisome proliferator-activated receptor gamma coactivator 1-beta n=1 Tax=Geospiza fortis TaxID=48883 RepID=A0A8N5EFF7_GEOFO|nr:peroxisome proliferator-activated receptor gamma coactivator 1-beta [Geospiza fortis]
MTAPNAACPVPALRAPAAASRSCARSSTERVGSERHGSLLPQLCNSGSWDAIPSPPARRSRETRARACGGRRSVYEVSGEEHLYSDFPEIDLSQLDAGDLDSAGCFSELHWAGEHSETDSSQYSTDDSELFQIIDSENEALLAALTETLDDIQGDDMGLAAFRTMEEGDTLSPATTSPAPSPKPTAPVTGGPPAPEGDELSLLKKLLLSPSPPSCEAQRDGSARRPGTPKSRPPRPCTKLEGPRDRRASVPQAQSRSCTELHRHLTSRTCPLCLGSLGDGEVATESQRCALLEQTETPRCLTLSLAQTDPNFGKRNFEPMLTVELCGTAGLTPPTTPPYKPAEEDLYKPDIPQEAGKEEGMAPGPGDVAASRKAPRKHPERTELFAHLSRARPLPEQQGLLKRPFSRSFGDHDYCQVLKPEPALQRKVLKSWEPPSQVETEHKRRVPAAHYQGLELGKDTGTEMLWKDGVKQLRDQEIRASLTKHFGFLDSALDDEDMVFCKTPEYDTVFEDSCSDSGSPVEEDEEEEEEEEEEHGDTKLCLRRSALSRSSLHYCSRSRSSSGSSCCRSRSPASRRTFRCENGEQCQGGSGQRGQLKKRREKAIGEGRVVYIRNLSSSMSSSELKKRFEVFGEIVECQVLTRTNRGEKYGFITYRYSEHAALSLKNGPSLRKRNEPSFQLSSGGLGRFFWTRYADLDCGTDESSPAPVKSKYETMDFDSLLQEAQLSLHR